MDAKPATLDSLSQRLQRLEKHSFRWRIVYLVFLLVIVSVPITWFAHEQVTLESKSFIMVDNQGRERATLSLSADGSPSLVFYDSGGKILALLQAKSSGSASLGLYSSSGDTLYKAP